MNEAHCKCYERCLHILLTELNEQSPGIIEDIERQILESSLHRKMIKNLIFVFSDQVTQNILIHAYNIGVMKAVINNILIYLQSIGLTPFESNLWLLEEKENLPPL